MQRVTVLVLLSFVLIQCTFFKTGPLPLSPREQLVTQITQLINDPLLDNAYIGIYIESLKDSSVIFEHDKYNLFMPASNQKLYTSAVALEKLGPDFRYETPFYIKGEIQDSVLTGDLIIKGKGDPAISGRFFDGDILKLFRDWADTLKHKGIKRIDGDLVGDDSYFSDYKLGEGWNWDDEPYYYSAQISALSFNENVVDLAVSAADSIGDSVSVSFIPETDYVTLVNTAKIVHPDSGSDLDIWRKRGLNIAELSGGLRQGSKDTISVTIEDPARWFLSVFSNVLRTRGISLTGELKTVEVMDSLMYRQVRHFFSYYSPALPEIISVVNKNSNNFYTEQLLKTIAAEVKNEGTAEAGSAVIREWLEEMGVSDKYAYAVDGSGLSRMNLVSPFATAAVLRKMYFSNHYQEFITSLPIAGVDGTLERRMKGSVAEGVVHAKTGFVRHARNLSGYTTDQSGTDYLFVILVNNYRVNTSYINELQNKIAILLTAYNPR